MSKTVIGAIVATLVIIVAGAFILIGGSQEDRSDGSHENAAEHTSQETTTTSENNNQNEAAVQATEVEIKDFAYSPQKIQVKKGSKVTWTNRDSTRHDVMPDNKKAGYSNSPLLGKDESYSYTFDMIGTYTYHCSPHPYMRGTVEVIE